MGREYVLLRHKKRCIFRKENSLLAFVVNEAWKKGAKEQTNFEHSVKLIVFRENKLTSSICFIHFLSGVTFEFDYASVAPVALAILAEDPKLDHMRSV